MKSNADIVRILALLLAAAAGLAGCGAQLSQGTGSTEFAPAAGPAGRVAGERGQPAGYVLSADEQELDCKQLTGKMQIRILELRASGAIQTTSLLSRGMQSAARSTVGASAYGLDPNGQHGRDVAMLEAYNRELVAKDCRSYDLAKALSGTDMPPSAAVERPSKSAAAAQSR